MGFAPFEMNSLNAEQVDSLFPPSQFPFLVGWRGSIAHNMFVSPDSPTGIDDKDVMAVTIAPLTYYLGIKEHEGSEKWLGQYDVVTYDVRKFVRLCVKANPNVLSLLWLEPNHYIYRSDLGRAIIAMRQMFMTQAMFHSFTGYAYGQLKRMTHHAYKGYMGDKRKALVDKFGYDTKNAAHLIRLLRMGIEALNEGELHVAREDAKQLLEIKRGEWTLERVQEESSHLFRRAEEAYDRCKLPPRADIDAISLRLSQVISAHFGDGFAPWMFEA